MIKLRRSSKSSTTRIFCEPNLTSCLWNRLTLLHWSPSKNTNNRGYWFATPKHFYCSKKSSGSNGTIGPSSSRRVIKLLSNEQWRAVRSLAFAVDAGNRRGPTGKSDYDRTGWRIPFYELCRRGGCLNLHRLSILDIGCRIEVKISLTPTAPPPAIIGLFRFGSD